MAETEALDTLHQELEHIAESNGGILRAEDVVEFASDPNTELHSRFTWDDTEAARAHRLWQARSIIRVSVRVIPYVSEPVRAFVSLVQDRGKPGGGYRPMVSVLTDDELRAKLLAQASAELRRIKANYGHLKELTSVWEVIN